MQINRTGIVLIAFFGLLGLALCVAPALLGAPRDRADRRLDRRDLGPRRRRPRLVRAPPEAKAAHQDWVFRTGSGGRATILEAGNRTPPSTRCR